MSTLPQRTRLRRALLFNAAICLLYAALYGVAPHSDYAQQLERGWGFGVVPSRATGTSSL